MTFTWDEVNSSAHFKKHKVYFEDEAVTVFDDPYAITIPDNLHGEPRFTRIGVSECGRLLRVTYAVEMDSIIIITARKASPANRKAYLTGLV